MILKIYNWHVVINHISKSIKSIYKYFSAFKNNKKKTRTTKQNRNEKRNNDDEKNKQK